MSSFLCSRLQEPGWTKKDPTLHVGKLCPDCRLLLLMREAQARGSWPLPLPLLPCSKKSFLPQTGTLAPPQASFFPFGRQTPVTNWAIQRSLQIQGKPESDCTCPGKEQAQKSLEKTSAWSWSQRQPETIRTKKNVTHTVNPRERGKSDFKSYHVIKFKCLVFNNNKIQGIKETVKYDYSKEKLFNKNCSFKKHLGEVPIVAQQ